MGSECRIYRNADRLIEKFKLDPEKFVYLIRVAKDAMAAKKIYTVCGNYTSLKISLENRGWIQKLEKNQVNQLKKYLINNERDSKNPTVIIEKIVLSEMLRKHSANFIWDRKDYKFDDDQNPLVNKIQMNNFAFTTKNGLCEATRDWHWHYVEGVSSINIPRSYNAFVDGDVDDFISDYKITACANMLKWLVEKYHNNSNMFIKNGDIPQSTITFALDQCSAYIDFKEHKDINWNQIKASDSDWFIFFVHTDHLIRNKGCFMNNKYNVMNYINDAKIMIGKIGKYNKLLSSEGNSNVWIIKPAYMSRGRGIVLESKLENIMRHVKRGSSNSKYIIQKYIEKPFLIHNTKFDIRQYFMITNTYPLTLWMYTDCYLRFSSQQYQLDDFHESIHLTNNSIQYKYNNCEERNGNLPTCNMWSLDEFRNHLRTIKCENVWDDIIYPEMRKNIIGVMLCCQSGMKKNNTFQLYGCDFVLDDNFKPWLLEINSNPALGSTTAVTAKICNGVLEDLVKDYRNDARANTGNFECIYKQHTTKTIHSYDIGNLTVYGKKIKKQMASNDVYKRRIVIKNCDASNHKQTKTNLNVKSCIQY